jgi:probable F420-dependent oxidoreductase
VGLGGLRPGGATNAGLLLCATQRLMVGTGTANIWARDPVAMAAAQRTLTEAYPGRFVLGIGVSHGPIVDARGHRYERPLERMRAYLDAMDAAPWQGPPLREEPARVLAALGPRMLELAAERSSGALTYNATPEATAWARSVLGGGPLLAVEQAVLVEEDPAEARRIGREYIAFYLTLANYVRAWERAGFGPEDLGNGGSDRLVDAVVAWGSPEAIAGRARAHLDAGADHVCLQVLDADPTPCPSAPGGPSPSGGRALGALAHSPDRLLDAAGPRIAVPGEHEAGGDVLEAVQGGHRLGGIGGEGRDLGAASARGDRVGRQRVADEQRVEGSDVEHRAPGRVAGRQDDPGTARHVQRRPIPERGHLLQLRRAKPTVQHPEPEEAEKRAELGRAEALGRVGHLAAGQGGVGLMDRHRDPPLAAEPLREADVVGVPVGQEQGADVGDHPAHRGQLAGDGPVVAGQAGIDDGHLAGVLQQVGVDEALVADAVDARCDLHEAS